MVNSHVDERGGRVRPQPLVDAQQPVGELEVGERPQAEDGDEEELGGVGDVTENEPRERARGGDRGRRARSS